MSLTVAVIASVVISAISGGVGWYLERYKFAVTEMLGMMIGMTFGMMTGIVVGYYIGAAANMFVSNLVGVPVGLGFGVVFGRAGGLMGMMDGGMGGMMGGMMGAMLGVMVNVSELAVSVTAVFMTALYLLSMVALVRLVQNSAAKQYAQDPVCDMMVDTATATLTSEHKGKTYYFCAPGCKRSFDKSPEKYVA
jgi:YHS domain-containing protein